MLVAAAVATHLALAPGLCDLNGNWTSSKKGTPPDQVVHIEFFQQPSNNSFTLRVRRGSPRSVTAMSGRDQTRCTCCSWAVA